MERVGMRIEVFKVTGKYAVDNSSGEAVYSLAQSSLENNPGQAVELNFSGVEVFATAFLNVAVGQLLRDHSPEELQSRLRITGLIMGGAYTLRAVIDNAKNYYKKEKEDGKVKGPQGGQETLGSGG